MDREPKKTESLEVRLPPETKSAFMSACRANGASASAVLRAYIDRYLRTAPQAPIDWTKELHMLFTGRSRYGRVVAGSLGVLTAGVAAITLAGPAVAAADPRLIALFEWVDTDHDQRISAAEFQASMSAAPPLGAISLIVDTKVAPPKGETRDALFRRLDGDRDGNVSMAELSEASSVRTVASAAIARADANNDGQLGEGELAAYLAEQAAAAGARNAARSTGLLARGIVAAHDRDQDGLVLLTDLQR